MHDKATKGPLSNNNDKHNNKFNHKNCYILLWWWDSSWLFTNQMKQKVQQNKRTII